MRVQIKQESRELFEATFSINKDNAHVGSIYVKGKIGTPESEIFINYDKIKFSMRRKRRAQKKELDAYRPYQIVKNGEEIGEVFQATRKTGLFKSYGYQYANIESVEASMYPIGFGDQGVKNPIFVNNEQVALIEKSALIIDDMHNFDVVVRSEEDMVIAIIFVAYIYAKAFFKPGDLVKKGKVKAVTVTTEKELISKYDDNFERLYG